MEAEQRPIQLIVVNSSLPNDKFGVTGSPKVTMINGLLLLLILYNLFRKNFYLEFLFHLWRKEFNSDVSSKKRIL